MRYVTFMQRCSWKTKWLLALIMEELLELIIMEEDWALLSRRTAVPEQTTPDRGSCGNIDSRWTNTLHHLAACVPWWHMLPPPRPQQCSDRCSKFTLPPTGCRWKATAIRPCTLNKCFFLLTFYNINLHSYILYTLYEMDRGQQTQDSHCAIISQHEATFFSQYFSFSKEQHTRPNWL